jgi:hypothetical protein
MDELLTLSMAKMTRDTNFSMIFLVAKTTENEVPTASTTLVKHLLTLHYKYKDLRDSSRKNH